MPKNWKYIKKLLEKEFLCEKLRGHITYDLTDYKPAPWYQQHFIMKYDAEVLLEAFQPERKWDKRYDVKIRSWENRDMLVNQLNEEYDLESYGVPKDIIASIAADVSEYNDKKDSHYRGIFGVRDIIDGIGVYLHSDIETSIRSGQYDFVRALAILDRRCGKRRLEKYTDLRYMDLPNWLKRIYQVRFEAEGIRYCKTFV